MELAGRGRDIALGEELANLSEAMGGTLLLSTSPFVYIHPHNAGVRVNCTSDVKAKAFIGAWKKLVEKCDENTEGNQVQFAWSLDGHWNSDHKKVGFAAAAIGETYRDPVQLGAIYLLMQEPFKGVSGEKKAWDLLPMCQGGSYNPITMRVSDRNEILVASTQVFQRCFRISEKSVDEPAGLDADGVRDFSQGRRMNGAISAYQWELSSKHYRKRVRYWYNL